ncbi:TPA: CHAP domain-containing protein [Streptococcus suis]|nr:CHAP domain-containing protein [Streptococcus suis]
MADSSKSRFERFVQERVEIRSSARERLAQLNEDHGKSKFVLKQAKKEVRASKYELRQEKRQFRYYARQSPELQAINAELREATAVLQRVKREGGDVTEALATVNDLKHRKKALLSTGKEGVKQARKAVKQAKRTKKQAIKQNGGTTTSKVLRSGRSKASYAMSRQASETFQEDDDLGEISTASYRFHQADFNIQRGKRSAHYAKEISKFVIGRTYNIGNRTYNFAKGNGFTKTPKDLSWHGRLGARYRKWKHKVNQNRLVQTARGAKNVGKWTYKYLRAIVRNPFSWKAYILTFILFLFLALLGFGSGVNIQDEYDLNQTWLHLTKLDRERSNEKVDYWTNWEDSLLYLNHTYDKWRFQADLALPDQDIGVTYLSHFWNAHNQDRNNLKSIQALYTDKKSLYYLPKEEREEYQELLESSSENGKFPSLQELENPFYPPDDEAANSPLKISNRFGYSSKDAISEKITLQIPGNHDVYAVMAGTVRLEGNQFIIETEDSRFTYYDVQGKRYKTGDMVTAGELIGKTKSEGNQDVDYEKYLQYQPRSSALDLFPKPKKEWVAVNPGFYFLAVEYTQATSVVSDIELSGEKQSRARALINEIKKREPKVTENGLASILGAWDIESSVTYKRYETDYLTGNQFDKVAQNPTAENLVGSWSAFQAFYPTLTLIEEGYLVNGLHYIGIGIGQWTGGRSLALYEYAKAQNLDIWSAEAQIGFLLDGDNPYYRTIFRQIVTSSDSVEVLTERFLNEWLGVPGNKLLERQNAAKQWLTFIKSGSGSTGASSATVPAEYKDKLPYGLPSDQAVLQGQGYPGNAYALGNCTWYVYNRFAQIGVSIYPYLGDAANWVYTAPGQGYTVTSKPQVGTAVVFAPGVAGSHTTYGHVAFCEYVNADGTFLVSEMNMKGEYSMTWRVLSPQQGIYFINPK